MSLDVVENQIKEFLTSAEPEVLAISGAWGIGKTFTLKKIVDESMQDFALDKYAYVSLFGVNSIESLKTTISQQIVSKDSANGSAASVKSMLTNLNTVISKKALPGLKHMPKIGAITPIIENLLFLNIRNTIICIDDLERKGSSLELCDVFGIISLLKEERDCKIIIIFNENEIKGINKEEYDKFKEKVIDINIQFNILPEESVNLVFNNDILLKEKIEKFVKILGITNIRILQKIQRLSKELQTLLTKYDTHVLHEALHRLVLFVCSHYSNGKDIPTLDFIEKFNFLDLNENDEYTNWNKILHEYGFSYFDDFERVIAEGVKYGYFSIETLKIEAQKIENNFKTGQSRENFMKAWEPFHNSFEDNTDEVIDSLKEGIDKNYRVINPRELSDISRLFRELGQNELADKVIYEYIERRKDEVKLFSLEEHPFYNEIKDSILIEKFRSFANMHKGEKSLEDILINITDNDDYTEEDKNILSEKTVDDFVALFESNKGQILHKIISAGIYFGKIMKPDEKHTKISQSVTAALKMLGNRSKLNAIRVRRYGINLEDAS